MFDQLTTACRESCVNPIASLPFDGTEERKGNGEIERKREREKGRGMKALTALKRRGIVAAFDSCSID